MCIIGLFLSLIAALVPTLIYGWFVNWLDRHEKEPRWLLALVFVWGAVPAFIMAVIAQLILDIPTTWVLREEGLASELVGGSIWAPITEEIAKGLGVVLVLLLARREMDSVLDGIVYGAMAGLGFAFTENVLYFGGALAEEGWGGWVFVVLLRTVPFGLNHAFFSGLTGAGLGAAYLSSRRRVKLAAPMCGLAGGMLFHSIHNLGASLTATSCLTICFSFVVDWGGILMLGVLIALIWRQEKSWMTAHLSGEVADEVYQVLINWRDWRRARWEAALKVDRAKWRRLGHIRQAATELAFNKRQMARRGQDPEIQKEIDRYRQRLVALNAVAPRERTD